MKWSLIGTKGFKYKGQARKPDGIQKAVLKGSDGPKAKALMKGKGMNLPDPVLGHCRCP